MMPLYIDYCKRYKTDFLLFILVLIPLFFLASFAERDLQLQVPHTFFYRCWFYSLLTISLGLLVLRYGLPIWTMLPSFVQSVIKESFVPFTFISLSFYHYGFLLNGDFLLTYDHSTHNLRAFLTENAIRKLGTLLPWTSAVGAGIPLNDLYPPGYALLCFLIRLVSLFALDIYTAYTASVFTTWFILLGGLYVTSRMLFGIPAGFIALCFTYFDPGSIGLSGWKEVFSIGMGPMALSNGFWVLSVFFFIKILQTEQHAKIISLLLPLTIAAAVISHSIALVSLGISFLLISVVHNFMADKEKISPVSWGWLLVFIGYGLSAWWWIPFAFNKEWILPFGTNSQATEMLGHHILNSTLFPNTPPIFIAVGIAGSIWGLFSKNRAILSLSLLYWFFLFTNQNIFQFWFYSEIYSNFIQHIPLFRFSVYAKLCGFMLAGALLQIPLQTFFQFLRAVQKNYLHGPLSKWRSINISAVVLILSLILLPCLYVLRMLIENYRFEFTNLEQREINASIQNLPNAADTEKLLSSLPSRAHNTSSFFLPFCHERIGIQSTQYECIIPIRYGYAIVPSNYTPTMLLTTRAMHYEPLNSTYSSMKYSLTFGEFYTVLQNVTQVNILQQLGNMTLLEHSRYSQTKPVNWVQETSGRFQVESQKYGYLRLKVTNLNHKEWLRIGISRFRKWHAYLNGTEIPIHEHIDKNESFDAGRYISVLADNGTLEFVYETEWVDSISYLVSYLSCAFLFLCLFFSNFFLFNFCKSIDQFASNSTKYIALGIVISVWLGLFFVYYFSNNTNSYIWYAGFMNNRVGTYDYQPDNELDLEFGIFLGSEHIGKTIKNILLKEQYPEALKESNNVWSSQPNHWKYTLETSSGKTAYLDESNPDTYLAINSPQFLRVFIGNPYDNIFGTINGHYIPTGTSVKCTIHFTDGTTTHFSAELGQQGHKAFSSVN